MRRWTSFSAVCLLAAWACRPPPPRPPPSPPAAPLEPDLEEILRDAAETEFPRCDPGGVPWDGRHEDCLYEVDLCCYGTPDEACRAARCAYHACSIVETAPAQILCEKGDNGAQRSARE